MAYVLFALSALMIVFGIYSLVTGYPVVQVEQGWTAVISGSTFIAGGIVTAALGLVLRVLVQIRNGLAEIPLAAMLESAVRIDGAPAVPPAPPPAADVLPEQEQEPPAAAPALAAAVAIASERTETPPPPPFKLKPKTLVEEAKPAQPQPARASRLDDDWLDQALQHRQDAATPIHDPGPSPEPEPVAPEPAPPPPVHAREAPAFPPPPPRPEHAPAPPPEPELEAPPVAPELEPEPVHEPREEATPVASAKVIGRYEADGTSYVMYADGSIEAQTESGVYRFASMAELKSFIET